MAKDTIGKEDHENATGSMEKTRRGHWVVIAAALGCGLLVVLVVSAKWKAPNTRLFREYVLDPIPSSVADIKADQTMGHGDWEYVFRFEIERVDFDAICRAHSLKKADQVFLHPHGISWAWRDGAPGKAGGELHVSFDPYALRRAPMWYDLPSWKDPVTYALRQEDKGGVKDIRILLYNEEIGCAYFITRHDDGRGL